MDKITLYTLFIIGFVVLAIVGVIVWIDMLQKKKFDSYVILFILCCIAGVVYFITKRNTFL